jgi:hypothetical protein
LISNRLRACFPVNGKKYPSPPEVFDIGESDYSPRDTACDICPIYTLALTFLYITHVVRLYTRLLGSSRITPDIKIMGHLEKVRGNAMSETHFDLHTGSEPGSTFLDCHDGCAEIVLDHGRYVHPMRPEESTDSFFLKELLDLLRFCKWSQVKLVWTMEG